MNFTVYKSSAGSGKTFTLVKEYLKLALADEQKPPEKYRHILAITFTNKAAAEMKERIISALKDLSEPGNNPVILKILRDETGLDENTVRIRAKGILQAILHNYADFAIGTIDSFVHRIVRTFAYDLRLPVNFEIEMDSNKLLKEVIELLISKAGVDEHLTRALVEFTESKAEEEKSWHIEKDLFEFAKNLLTEDGIIHLERLKNLSTTDFLSIRKVLNESIRQFESSIQNIASEAMRLIIEQGLEHTAFYYGRTGISAWFSNLSAANFDKLEPNSYIKKTITENKWFTDKTSAADQANIEKISGKLSEAFHAIQLITEKQQALYCLFKLINKNIYSLAVLNEIEKLLEELKRQNNILHISEFNKLISRIALSQPVPFIYERIGEKYNHYLIDEFQDTSVMQWQNLLPLIENSLAEGHSSMLVGDGKQAIYRWRGGEVEQFSQLPNVFLKEKNEFVRDREQTLKRNFNEKQLNRNFRSKKEIIEFNNSLFATLANKLDEKYKNIYKNLEQLADQTNTGGFISLNFIQESENGDLAQLILEQIHTIILQSQADRYQLKDIAILCRTNKTGSIIAEHLIQKGISVLSPDSLLLKNSRKVQFIGSLLNHVNHPFNDISKVEILQYLIENNRISEDLHSLINSLKNKRSNAFAHLLRQNGFEFNQLQLIKLPLYELVEHLVKVFKLGETADAFVQFFMDEVLEYSISNNNNLSDFIEWWEVRKESASLNVPGGINAVSIMTIHRSKGLEFPLVILPNTSSKSNSRGNLWVDLKHGEVPSLESVLLPLSKEMEKTKYADLYLEEKNKSLLDDINLLYVALTRPEERLYILSPVPSQKPENLGSLSDMLCHYLQTQHIWNDHQSVYEFGVMAKHPAKKEEISTTVKLKKFLSCDWRSLLKIRADAPEAWGLEEYTSKKDFGLIVHAILSKVRLASDLAPVLTQFLNDGIIDVPEKEQLLPKLKSILEHEQIRNFYKEGSMIKTETSIILPNGESFRPDRVVISRNLATIIDYKTGVKKDEHIKQIKKYAELISRMGYPDVEQYLVYIDDESILKV